MATTTNYGWSTPDNTGLVKNGALDIRTLGNSIDTTTKALNPSTTLGDIEYRSSTANTNTRLGIGSTGQVLTVSGGVPAWSTPASGGGMTAIATGTLSSTGVTFSSISGSYVNLELHITGYNVGGNRLRVRINGDTGNNYFGFYARERNSSATLGTYVAAGPTGASFITVDGEATPDSGATNSTILEFPAYATTTGKKIVNVSSYTLSSFSIPSINPFAYTGTDAAITSITILTSSGTFSAGTYTLYGVK